MIAIASIVEILSLGKIGVVAETYAGPAPSWVVFFKDRGGQLCRATALATDLVLVSPPPVFTPGERITLPDGSSATVIADQGATITAETHNRVALAVGHHAWSGVVTLDKPSVVALNKRIEAPS